MVQPNGGSTERPRLFVVGCAGRITSFAETEDGRYLITLTGVCRYDLVEELRVSTPYRQVCASFERWQTDLEPPAPPECLRPQLFEALRGSDEITCACKRKRGKAGGPPTADGLSTPSAAEGPGATPATRRNTC